MLLHGRVIRAYVVRLQCRICRRGRGGGDVTCPGHCNSGSPPLEFSSVSQGGMEYRPFPISSRYDRIRGNLAVYGYKAIIFFLLHIYASNHASDQCTKCAVMLRDENIHTIITVDEIDRFLSYLPTLCT